MPAFPIRTCDMSTRLAILREFRPEFRNPFDGTIDDSGYAIEAPHFIPGGSLKRESTFDNDYQTLVIR